MGVISKISRLPANLLILLFGCLFFLLPGCGNDVVNKTDVGTLSINATGVGFGNVVLNTPKTQTVILSSTGIESITVSSAAVTGVGFSLAGSTIPITLAPGETATLFVQFDPTEVGAATGQLAIASNSSSNATVAIPLTGTGISASYAVELSWDAPSSSKDPIAGYNIYRSTGNTLAYQLLNSQVNTQTGYVDSAVENGQSYNYTVTSVDASGVESVPTSPVAVVIP